jgi:hypothetical protein
MTTGGDPTQLLPSGPGESFGKDLGSKVGPALLLLYHSPLAPQGICFCVIDCTFFVSHQAFLYADVRRQVSSLNICELGPYGSLPYTVAEIASHDPSPPCSWMSSPLSTVLTPPEVRSPSSPFFYDMCLRLRTYTGTHLCPCSPGFCVVWSGLVMGEEKLHMDGLVDRRVPQSHSITENLMHNLCEPSFTDGGARPA